MLKKMMLLALAAGALLAFVAPAAAQAEARLTDMFGEPIKIGAEVTATSTDLRFTTGNNEIECALVTLHAEVTENGPETITMEKVVPTLSGCFYNVTGVNKFPTTFTKATGETILLSEFGGMLTSTFTWDTPALGLKECRIHGIIGFVVNTETDVLSVPGSAFEKEAGSGASCPAEMEVHGSFTLENAVGPVTVD